MNPSEKPFEKPPPVVQYYDPVVQKEFQKLTYEQRLEWLESIQALYLAGWRARQT
jgi:hypothetical protein